MPANESSATVYTREGCHLCDDAIVELKRAGFNPKLVDVDSDPRLVETYGDCVPVVSIDGKVRFRGRVSPILLKRLLHGGSTQP